MQNSSDKIIGGTTLALTLLLAAAVGAQCADTEEIIDAFGSLFDTNTASVMVESFGDE